ncbi:MAG: hypothetical protein AB7H86_02210 [Blastocatellales bacterium]
MTELDRWKIDELLTRYELEPELRDFFVEGKFDVDVFSRVAEHCMECSEFRFYDIDCVDVPLEVLERYDLSSGNKQRVMALAKELDNIPGLPKVVCLVDRDLDHWTQSEFESRVLKTLSYCSLECFFYKEEIAKKILIVTGKAKITDFSAFLQSLEQVLRMLFAMRLADQSLGCKLRWLDVGKYIQVDGNKIKLDSAKYVTAVLNSSAKHRMRTEFESTYKDWLSKISVDIRLCMRGHDYTELLAWSISRFRGVKSYTQREAVERLYVLLTTDIAKDLCGELSGAYEII